MTAPATHPCRFDLDVSPSTLASLAATAVPILATADTHTTVLQLELDLITAELTELQTDAAMAKKMTATTEWREEIRTDRDTLRRRAQQLRQQLATPEHHDGTRP